MDTKTPGSFHLTSAPAQTVQAAGWQPIASAPMEFGSEILAWFQKIKLDDNDDPTDEVIGGAMAHIERQGDGWTEPEWLSAHGSYFMEDWCFGEQPVLWHPLPPEPVASDYVRAATGSQP